MSTYNYTSLQHPNNLRFITLHPGRLDEDVTISLRESSFDKTSPPYYEALSYVWGSEADPKPVHVDDQGVLLVTQNLFVALQHLRLETEARTLWVDALCINQSDNDEKSEQVNMMGEVFRLASRVTAWLGHEDVINDSDRAMQLMEYMGSQVKVDYMDVSMESAPDCTDSTMSQKDAYLSFNSKELGSLFQLLSRLWFERLWIRQEIFLAGPQTFVQCGHRRVTWETFRAGLFCLFAKRREEDAGFNQLLQSQRGLLFQEGNQSLLSLRYFFGMAKCQDPRDRIYAVNAMLNEHERNALGGPDYNKSVLQVYHHAFLQILSVWDDLDLLRDCELDTGCIQSLTWVPDWSRENTHSYRMYAQMASSNLSAWYSNPWGNVLKVVGASAAVVREVEPIGHPAGYDDVGICRWIHHFLYDKDLTGNYITGDSMITAYAKILVCNRHSQESSKESHHTLKIAVAVVEKLSTGIPKTGDINTFDRRILSLMDVMQGKKFIVCEDGHIGLTPPATEPGDQVCTVLGCNVLLMLRPTADGFIVVGPCFVLGFTDGEALMGPLPTNIRVANMSVGGRYRMGFIDELDETLSLLDPRLDKLDLDLTELKQRLADGAYGTVRIEPEELKRCGVNVQYFDLI